MNILVVFVNSQLPEDCRIVNIHLLLACMKLRVATKA